jgi:hypothetical protein
MAEIIQADILKGFWKVISDTTISSSTANGLGTNSRFILSKVKS